MLQEKTKQQLDVTEKANINIVFLKERKTDTGQRETR